MANLLWLNHDNELDLELSEDGSNISIEQYDAINRITMVVKPLGSGTTETLDSDVTSGLFSWGTSGPGRMVRVEGSKLDDAGLEAGNYRARLVAYSDDQPEGIVFADFPDLRIHIRV